MPRVGNPDGLRSAAEQKKNDALERTDKAISQMVKQGKKINFHTVAVAAGVSVAYLYKYDAIKQRIDQLRKQQSPIKELVQKKGASEDSKAAIISTFKERIKKQELEIKGLRDHIEVTQGIAMQVPELKQQIEFLNSENLKLREQLDDCRRQREVSPVSEPPVDNKINSLAQKRIERSDISDKIKPELASLGIKLNTTLSKTIKSTSVELVLSAIQALKEAMASGNIERPGGWLNAAIKDGWKPNEKYVKKGEWENFNEWFNLAKKQGLIVASMKDDDDKLYVFAPDGTRLSFEQMLAEYPLDILRGKSDLTIL
jgi:Family of unknown function (DUF6262)